MSVHVSLCVRLVYEYADVVTVINTENEIDKPLWNRGLGYLRSIRINALEKGMDPSICLASTYA